MYSSDAPPSIAGGGMNSLNLEHQINGFQNNHLWQNLQIQATGDVYGQPPSMDDVGHHQGNSSNQHQEVTTDRGIDQTGEINVDDTKAPSLTGFGRGQGNSYNQDPNTSRGLGDGSNVSGTGGGPFSVSDMVKGRVSETSEGVGSNQEGKAPSRSDLGQRGTSETGQSSGVVFDGPDAQEFVGISLVGKNFRKYYPNAYYKEEDEEN